MGGLGTRYDVHLRLIGKLVGDFLLVIIELFSLDAFVLSQYTRLTDGRTDRPLDSNTNFKDSFTLVLFPKYVVTDR